MRVVGGIYRERCLVPGWDQIFGSAGRAACAVSSIFKHKPTLSGSYAATKEVAVQASFAPYQLKLDIHWGRSNFAFSYAHPLARPICYQEGPSDSLPSRHFRDDVTLLFGTIGATYSVATDRLVIDPQGELLSEFLDQGLFSANTIAAVANARELGASTERNIAASVKATFNRHKRLASVVIKRGTLGALVFDRKRPSPIRIPPYRAGSRVFKIGSGDVFTAAFAYLWGEKSESPASAADFASRATAAYVNDPYFNFKPSEISRSVPIKMKRTSGQIYLAGPFFTLTDLLTLAEARAVFSELGAKVFSPLHDVGFGHPEEVAAGDLKGLKKSHCLFALLHNADPGTLFEIGYARSKNIPVVVHCERALAGDSTMLVGSNCTVEADFCTAIYKAHWTALGAT